MVHKVMIPVLLVIVAVGVPSSAFSVDSAWSRVATISDKRIDESSSLAISSRFVGIAYTANDESSPEIYAIDIASGRVVGKTKLTGTKLRDPEAMALDGAGTLWFADTGDNSQRRRDATLYASAEQGPTNRKIPVKRYPISYADGRRYNVETLLVDPISGEKFLVAKSKKGPGAVFALGSTLRPNEPNVATSTGLVVPRNISDGAVSPNGAWIVLRDATQLYVYSRQSRSLVQSVMGPRVRKGESLAFNPSGSTILVGSEGKKSPLFSVPFDQAAGRIATR